MSVRPAVEFNVSVGKRLREQRLNVKMSQQKLAELIDVSLQQFQKYEKGENRLSAGRLYQICSLIDVRRSG